MGPFFITAHYIDLKLLLWNTIRDNQFVTGEFRNIEKLLDNRATPEFLLANPLFLNLIGYLPSERRDL